MTRKCMVLFIGLLAFAGMAKAQAMLKIQPVISQENQFLPTQPLRVSNSAFQPRFVQENPTGYSYLCRLELSIEAKSPIPVWIKLNEEAPVQGRFRSNADVRFKLLKF